MKLHRAISLQVYACMPRLTLMKSGTMVTRKRRWRQLTNRWQSAVVMRGLRKPVSEASLTRSDQIQ